MKRGKAILVAAFIPAVLLTTWLMIRSQSMTLDTQTTDQLQQLAEDWYMTRSGEIPAPDWPDVVRKLKPISVRIDLHGLWIVRDKMFVEERGWLIVPGQSPFEPTSGGDPDYRIISGRVYRYHIRG